MTIILCPHCEEPTQPNRLADGSLVCSCAAARALPQPAAVKNPRAPAPSTRGRCV
jgi:hypothetical protein